MSIINAIYLLSGLLILTLGADWLVRGASRIAIAIGITPLVVGLTIVACGTSAPELAVSIQAGLNGQSEIAVGNVVGSNIFNILFILGCCGLVGRLETPTQLLKLDGPVMTTAALLAFVFGRDGVYQAWEGAVLLSILVLYIAFLIRLSRRRTEENRELEREFSEESHVEEATQKENRLAVSIIYCVIGLAFLVLGAQWLVDASVVLAKDLGISNTIIGLTIVAAGTSLPEVATSIVATIKGEREIAIGNVIGSNTFNILGIIGMSSLVAPKGLSVTTEMLWIHIPLMILISVGLFPMLLSGRSLNRIEGAVLFGGYVAYTIYLIWSTG